jgi:hypothetical protein
MPVDKYTESYLRRRIELNLTFQIGQTVWVDLSSEGGDKAQSFALPPWPATVSSLSPPTVTFLDSSFIRTTLLRILPFTSFNISHDDVNCIGSPYETRDPYGTFRDDVFDRNWRSTGANWSISHPEFTHWQNDVISATQIFLTNRIGQDSSLDKALHQRGFSKKMKKLEELVMQHHYPNRYVYWI